MVSPQFSSVQSLSCVRPFATPWTATHQVSLSITNSQSLPKLMSIKSEMSSNHLILCRPLLLLPSIYPSIRVFSSELAFPTSSVQSFSHVQLFVAPWTAAHQVSLSITNSQSLLKLMSIESVMPSNHLILCRPLIHCFQSFPALGSYPMSHFFASGGKNIGVSASASALPMNIQH